MNKFSLRILKISYYLLSISVHPNYQKYFYIFLCVYFCSLFTLNLYFQLSTIIITDEINVRLEAFAASFFIISSFFFAIVRKTQKLLWMNFYECITNDNKYLLDEIFFNTLDVFLARDLFSIIYTFLSFSSLMLLFPLSAVFLEKQKLGALETLPIACLFPWKVNTPSQYVMTLLFQLFSYSILTLWLVGSTLFIYFFRALVLSSDLYFQVKIKSLCSTFDSTKVHKSCSPKSFLENDLQTGGTDLQILCTIIHGHNFFLR